MALAANQKTMTFILRATDGVDVHLEKDAAFQSNLLKKMVTDLEIEDADSPMLQEAIPIQKVDGFALKKIADWCNAHKGIVHKEKEDWEDSRVTLTKEDDEWMDVDNDQLKDIYVAANYLDIPGIVDIISQKIANMANGKSIEEIRQVYGLTNDFTPEEMAELNKQFQWIDNTD